MNDLVAFLRARLDEDEEAASIIRVGGFHPPTWSARPGRSRRWMEVVGRSVVVGDSDDDWCDDGLIALVPDNRCEWVHIARHDPARVLREVESKREILDWACRMDPFPGTGGILAGEARKILGWLALPYVDHEDYASAVGPVT